MPGARCSMINCKNYYEHTKNLGIHYFRFPRNPLVLQEWLDVTGHLNDENFNPKTRYVCSDHFKKVDINEVITTKGIKYLLNKNTMPIPVASKISCTSTGTFDISDMDNKEAYASGDTINNEIQLLKNHIKKLEAENKSLKRQLTKKIQTKEKTISEEVEKGVNNILSNFLTQNQIDIITKKKKKVVWTSQELTNAFTLRYLGVRGYRYVKENLKFPLPSLSTLKKWGSKMNLKPGIFNGVLNFMKISGEKMSDKEKICVLSFDEMKVKEVVEYNKKADQIVGPHRQMQVGFVRGLFSKWKQPVYTDFDKKMTKEIINNIISRLHEVGYTVVAIVSDCGSSNMGLWKNLNISTNNVFFNHPITGEPIFVFADAPHLLKLIRNWYLDTGFLTENGAIISKNSVEELVNKRTEVSSVWKINLKHVTCQGVERQNVKLAAELMSHTVATAIKQYSLGDNPLLVSEFIDKVNVWFDVMNSYTLNSNVPTKAPFGVNLQMQLPFLDSFSHLIKSMRCVGKNNLQIFQKAMLISINSLKELYNYLSEKYNITFLLTHRLNQDCLENFFSQIRTRGGLHDHPSPLNALYRIRMIILGKAPGQLQFKSNLLDVDEDEILLSKLLKESLITLETSEEDLEDFERLTVVNVTDSETAQLTEITEDGLEYLAGWIAKKLKNSRPDLISNENIEHDYCLSSWVAHLSFGGLVIPSNKWKTEIKQFEIFFYQVLKNNLPKGKRITDNLYEIFRQKFPNCDEDVLKLFIRQRLFIRIKYINSLKNFSNYKTKKIKKIVS